MSDYITLVGTETVQNAANRMMSAAETMNSAASQMECTLTQHQRFLDDWLLRLEQMFEKKFTQADL